MRLHSLRYGAEYPVDFLLVHGLASCARLWDAVGLAIATHGRGSVAVDLRGHGESPKPDDGYDFDTVIDDLVPFLGNRPVVVGQSYGGNVVMELAARHPDAVAGVACIDGGAIDLSRRFASLDDAIAALRPPYERFEGIPLSVQETRLRAAHPDWSEISIQAVLAAFVVDAKGGIRSRLTWERHRQIITAMWETPPAPSGRGAQIGVPVLFVMASEGMRDGVDAAVASLPDASSVWFADGDHDLHAQKSVEIADLLLSRSRSWAR